MYIPITMNFDIKIIPSPKRKTISLQIMPDASITIKVPSVFPKQKIEEFIKQHEAWIRQKQEEIKKKYRIVSPKKFVTGEQFLYLGKQYPLTVSHDIAQAFIFTDAFYLNAFNHKNAETHALNWYKKQALQLFTQRVSNYAEQLKIEYQSIALSSANSKWGSCSYDNKLMFNWRLIMAPVEVIDSVIFHELAHVLEKNHTKRFWRKVTMWFPAYEEQKAWLDKNGHTLVL